MGTTPASSCAIIVVSLKKMKKPNIVCIGGGTGQAAILEGLKKYPCNLTAIVGVTDNGGYSGIIRQALDIPQTGDSRSVLASLADNNLTLTKLLKYRFREGALSGVSLGNLLLAALTRLHHNDFSAAVAEVSKLLAVKATVLPVTNASTQICAELLDGAILEGEWDIIKKSRSKIKKLFLKHPAQPSEGVLRALRKADMIIVSPGSLRTGIIPLLLVDGIARAIAVSKATKVYICNIMTHPGQTDNFTASMHLREIKKYCKTDFDYVLVNSGKPSSEMLAHYQKDGAVPVQVDAIKDKTAVIIDNFVALLDRSQLIELDRASGKGIIAFPHFVRHDSAKVARILMELAG